MRHKEFTIVFTNHNYERLDAFCKREAVILAQARQIEKGNSYNVEFVKDENGRII